MSPDEFEAFVREIGDEQAKKWLAQSEAELRGWLSLDTWTVDEGLLLIGGIDPEAAVLDCRGWRSALGAGINRVRILNARPLSRHPIFFAIPEPQLPKFSDYQPPAFPLLTFDPAVNAEDEELKWEKVSVLRDLEKHLNSIIRLWRSGEHDRKRYPVAYFIAWAEKHCLDIPWLQQAREKGWIPVHPDESDSLQPPHPGGLPPEPAAAQQQPAPANAITRSEVMAHFRVKPDPQENERFWDDKLADPPKWLIPARVSVGKPGTSSSWSPLGVAHCLLSGYHGRPYMTLQQLDVAINRGFPELFETWYEETQDLR